MGLRLEQYMATMAQGKENFRANFVKATEALSADDLAFFRGLPIPINVAVATEDANLDALRDVPIIGRLSAQVRTLVLRLFRPTTHADVIQAIAQDASSLKMDGTDGGVRLPIIAFYTPEMQLIGAHVCRLPELSAEMNRRRSAWIESHPEVLDAREPMEKMTPITRTRLTQAMYALTSEERAMWGRLTVQYWRRILRETSSLSSRSN
ncbi:MAG: hypothetical protein D6709_05350 [Chloroflexi bacterium]|jgi:hypothetical protein|uniref:Uncharacterized protein n=2 Tax=Candidatus Thermofonsia Clade 3 TaxID=2364209 RepID=A0A2M8QBL3_9CHLR|nr:MAG: hypothetical protein CUN48_09950 [Candidatus Thermofonsia Clade 3 bacterium]RMG64518.1 MAG: hypothetical protein D6709_05350 [Chloroflexota bacterium]